MSDRLNANNSCWNNVFVQSGRDNLIEIFGLEMHRYVKAECKCVLIFVSFVAFDINKLGLKKKTPYNITT